MGAVDATGYTVAQIRERASVAAPAEMSAAGIDTWVGILERSPLSLEHLAVIASPVQWRPNLNVVQSMRLHGG